MSWPQFALLALSVLVGIVIAVEVSIRLRWHSITEMFDRALMHGGSLDTLSRALRENSEASKSIAEEASKQAAVAVDAVGKLHKRVRALEEHPFIRPMGGTNGDKP